MAPTPARQAVFAPLRVEGAAEAIVRRLGEAIGSGLLQPGERLPRETDLAAMLDVAPMTLRTALAVLREAGYVETRRGNGGGTYVRPGAAPAAAGAVPSAAELRALTDWRRAVSGEAAALAAERAGAPEVRAIVEGAAGVERRAGGGFAEFRLADSRFHIAVAEAGASPRLVAAETALQAALAELLGAIPAPVRARRASANGHQPIVDAIAGHDPRAAREAVIAHVEATHDWFVGLRLGRLGAGAGG
jgi:GntR family transcriptional regulator, transcriptional repressor for pyruvate dehydrogenase complex